MGVSIDDLSQQLEAVRQCYSALAERMTGAVAALGAGVAPPPDLAQDVQACAEVSGRLRAGCAELLEEEVGQDVGLNELAARLEAFRQRRARDEVDKVSVTLGQVLRLRHRSDAVFAALGPVQDSARELLCGLETTGADGADLAASARSFADLLELALGADSLAPDAWDEVRARVVAAFGLEVAAEAARNRLALDGTGETKTAAARPLRAPQTGGGNEVAAAAAATSEHEDPADAEVKQQPSEAASEDGGPNGFARGGAEANPGPGGLADLETQSARATAMPPEGAAAMAPEVAAGIWAFVRQGRPALAYQLARTAAGQGCLPADVPVPALLRALVEAPWLSRAGGQLASDLRECFTAPGLPMSGAVGALLTWAAAARPALLAPATGADSLMRAIRFEEGWRDLFALSQAICEVGEVAQGVDLNTLRGARGLAAWQADLEQAQQDAQTWMEQAPAMHFLGPATGVWRKLVQRGGALAEMLAPVAAGRVAAATAVGVAANQLADRGAFRRLVDDIDRRLRPKNFERIHARALEQLVTRTQEGIAFARTWLDVLGRRPEQHDYLTSRLTALRTQLLERAEPIGQQLTALVGGQDPAAAAAGGLAQQALADLRAVLDEDAPLAAAEPEVSRLLGQDLLLLPEVELDAAWQPVGGDPSVTDLLSVVADPPDWQAVFTGRLQRLDFRGCERVAEVVQEQNGPAADVFRQHLAEAREEARAEHSSEQVRLSEGIEEVLHAGLMDEAERTELDGQLVEARRLADALDLRKARSLLSRVAERLEDLRRVGTADAVVALDQLPLDPEDPTRLRIHQAIAAGDLVAAQEYLDRVRQGQSITGPAAEDVDRFEAWRTWLEAHEGATATGAEIYRQVRAKDGPFGALFADLTAEEEAPALQLLDAWSILKASHQLDAPQVRRLLASLGFGPVRVDPVHPASGKSRPEALKVNFSCRVIADRSVCPVPLFGSEAGGHYRIVCTSPRVESFAAALEDAGKTRPTIILHFGRLDTAQRRAFARQCRAKSRSGLLIDDWLVLFLASRRPSRLPWLFAATLPYTAVQPYVTGTGVVPPEMFYGRQQELSSLIDSSDGRCFVYGGRQLGKTALLREAERRFHDPESGRIAILLDLKTKGIGIEHGSEELWSRLVPLLQKFGVLPTSFHLSRSTAGHAEPVMGAITGWLGDDPDRRILLLLDEADAFLDQDGQREFPECYRLKGLMEDSKRHFKVVFAGLHNVVRTATQVENHPLAHLGEPISVGPLAHNGEWHEARALIKLPLEAIGYRFASEDLPVRIMAHTNYYPGFIQAYCTALLSRLAERHRDGVEFRDGPTCLITAEHVDQAYDADLREAIRYRFSLTLRLDLRYEVIAYAMADEFLSGRASIGDGLTLREIESRARYWWPEGFSETLQRGDLGVLLAEMEVLGVTARLSQHPLRYTLRNPNILPLLGTHDEIETELLKDRSVPAPFEAAQFHAAMTSWEDDPRHPLTVQQEARLREPDSGVTLLFGTEAAGLVPDQLAALLRDRAGAVRVTSRSASAFSGELARIGARQEGTTIALAMPESGWDAAWVEVAAGYTSGLVTRTRHLRVVLVGGPEQAWALCAGWRPSFDAADVEVMAVRPWQPGFLARWAEDVQVGPNAVKDLDRATGGWWALLKWLREHGDDLGKLEAELGSDAGRTRFRAAFGLSIPEAVRGLQAVARHCEPDGGLLAEDVPAIAEIESQPVEDLLRALRWGAWTGIVADEGEMRWVLDPVLRRLLTV